MVFITRRSRRDTLDDYRSVVKQIYAPDEFFGRVRRVADALRIPQLPASAVRRMMTRDAGKFVRLMIEVTLRRPDMRRQVWSLIAHLFVTNRAALPAALRLTALYLHLGSFSRYVVEQIDLQVEGLDPGAWVQPDLMPTETPTSLPSAA